MTSVNGKVALITGGANGIGAEVARRLHTKGAKLVLTDLDEGQLESAASALGEAGVEHFANALRLEVAYRGVDVGSAHMSWIDTAMVRDSKADLPSTKELIESLPGPLAKTTTVQKCAEAFVKGIEARKRRINCPRWVGALRWLKPLLSTPVGEAQTNKTTPQLLPRMDAEVAALGRSTSAHTEAIENR
jgi:short-subunit dehydrogenase